MFTPVITNTENNLLSTLYNIIKVLVDIYVIINNPNASDSINIPNASDSTNIPNASSFTNRSNRSNESSFTNMENTSGTINIPDYLIPHNATIIDYSCVSKRTN